MPEPGGGVAPAPYPNGNGELRGDFRVLAAKLDSINAQLQALALHGERLAALETRVDSLADDVGRLETKSGAWDVVNSIAAAVAVVFGLRS